MAKGKDPQYIAVRFNAGGKPYTYHNDGEPVSIGQQVKIPDKDGEGWRRAEVVGMVEKPNFKTKGIAGLAPDAAPARPSDKSEEEDAPAAELPGVGHNRPPPYSEQWVEHAEARVVAFADAAGEWLELGKIEDGDEPLAGRLNDFITGARKVVKEIEERRVAEKAPHLEAGRLVDERFGKLKTPLERAIDKAKKLLTDFARRKDKAEQDRIAAEQRRIAAEREELERKAREAESRHDVIGEDVAERRRKELEKEERAFTKTAKAARQVKSSSGGGRAAALVKQRRARIDSINKALLYYRDRPEIHELVITLANAEIRAAKGAPVSIPGIEVITEEVMR